MFTILNSNSFLSFWKWNQVPEEAPMSSPELDPMDLWDDPIWLTPQSISRFFGETAPDRRSGLDNPGPTLDPSRFRTAHAGSLTEGQP